MKRSAELAPLSRDHHFGLHAALVLSRATDVEAVRDEALGFWRQQGQNHFSHEESVLLPGWLMRDPAADHELASRVMREHLELRIGFRRLEDNDLGLGEAQELGAALERHIRFEERELFPAIEAGLDRAALAALGSEIAGSTPLR